MVVAVSPPPEVEVAPAVVVVVDDEVECDLEPPDEVSADR